MFLIGSSSTAQVQFIENKGQWDPRVTYRADLVNGNLWLTDSGLLFSLWDEAAAELMHDRGMNTFELNRHAFYLHFKGARFTTIQKQGPASEAYYNYFLGNDPSRWASEIHSYNELLVKEIYPGVDLRLFSNGNTLKYNLECSKGTDVSQIILQYIGTDGISVSSGKIEVSTSVQNFTEAIPKVYSISNGVEKPLSAIYEASGNEIRFKLNLENVGSNDRIIIDPILVFSTYSGSRADNFGCTGTYDDLGNGFAGGTVFDVGLPLTLGAFQTNFGGGVDENLGYGGGRDAAILKFSKDGKNLLFGTYLGGSNNEQPHSMVATSSGELYVMGSTRSTNFPVTVGCYDNTHNGDYDFFVVLINSTGTQLKSSTYVGSAQLDAVGADRQKLNINDFPLLYNYADEFRGEIITDDKFVYISGTTYSPNFPRSDNSGWFGGKEDACLFSLSADLKTLQWSQLVGREGHDAFYGVAFGEHNDIYASGGTTSDNLPVVFKKFENQYKGGMADAFISRFNRSTGAMLSSAYIGTTEYEQGHFVQTDNSGNPYVFGQTEGSFPIFNSPFGQPGTGQFIVRLDSTLKTTTLSTSFGANGNNPNISPTAFLVDQCERIFISGWGGKVNEHLRDSSNKSKTHRNRGDTRNLLLTPDAQQKNTDGSDFYVAVFAKNMYQLLYSTYFGGVNAFGNAEEHVDGGTSRFDKKGIIYQAVCAGCGANSLFPTTPGAYSRINNSTIGGGCNNALFKIDFENLNKKPVMPDTFVELMATDVLDLINIAVDPDPQDVVRCSYQWVKKGGSTGSDTPLITVLPPLLGSASLRVQWTTTCTSWSKDTIELRVMVFDLGCPKADTTYATIKILVNEPPKVVPPETVCVSYNRQTQDLEVSWPASTQSARFFKHFLLKRRNPDGSVQTMTTINHTNAGTFTDKTITDPEVNNYCYFLEGYNTCDTKVANLREFCTVRELTDPINDVRMRFATVEEDERVLVAWEDSDEPDFKEYELYRYPRNGTMEETPFLYTTNNNIIDTSFDVDALSFCYRIVVADKCGHISNPSNEGCNVVIKGSATGKPQYFFDFEWQDYQGWKGGVDHWELERQYKNYPWSLVENTSTLLSARDDKLDFDWGGYWYRVNAKEYAKGQNHLAESSQSNWIYLIQPPEVYVPSGITINGDNLNDVWGTVPVFVLDYSMKVYNRWGQKVWESTDKYAQWDGFIHAVQPEDGVFAWHVTFTGWDSKTYYMTGTVTLLH